MESHYFKDYSPALGRDMELKVWGHHGRPVLFIPCQDGHFNDFEGFHMTDTWAPWIESGRVMVFSIDTLDIETWSNKSGDPGWRGWRQEQWVHYITDEVVPFMQAYAMEKNGWDAAPGVLTFGCSLGATHAANLFLRRPDLFDGCLALSGIYTASYGWDGYMDENVYNNSPVDYMANMPADHPYISMYNDRKGIICVGTGAWELPESTARLDEIFKSKGIHIWCDFWGSDVNHDWPWWHKQVAYFVPYLLGDQ